MSIFDLPPELVLKILGSMTRSFLPPVRRDFLLAASLVCCQWRPIAQGILWDTITLTVPSSRAERMLASPAIGRHRTRELSVSTRWVPEQERRDEFLRMVISALDKLYGIESLELSLGVNDFPSSLLQNPTLAGLKFLTLFATRIIDPPSVIPFPFALQALALRGPIGSTLVPSIVKASPRLFRISATNQVGAWAPFTSLCDALLAAPPLIRELALVRSFGPEWLPVVRHSTSLEYLAVESTNLLDNLVDILPVVAPSLATLKISYLAARSENRQPIFDLLHRALSEKTLLGLRYLVLDVDSAKVRQSEAGRKLLARCEHRRIEVTM